MPRQRVTSHDVARLAGVSQPTVSRVFAPNSRVSVRLRQQVQEAADSLGYRPNTLARSLTTGRSGVIGVVLAGLSNPFYAMALEKLSSAFQARGYRSLVFFSANHETDVDSVVEDLIDHQVDGIVLASVSISNTLTERLKSSELPFVLFNRGQQDASIPSVTATNFLGGRVAAHALAAAGCERIAHFSGWQLSLNGRQRQQGFLHGLSELGLSPVSMIDCAYRPERAAEAARDVFGSQNKASMPDGVFVGNDNMAFAVLDVLRYELRIDVPEAVSVIGFDDVPAASSPAYGLTTVRQPTNRMVDVTANMLCDMIDGAQPSNTQIEIEGALIQRGSVRLPEGWIPPDFADPADASPAERRVKSDA